MIHADSRFPGRLLPGSMLRDQYKMDTLIGVGGMGAVYLAEHAVTHQQVAIKVLWPDLAENPSEVKRFKREARAASVLTHPNTVRVYDFGLDATTGAIFMVMEYLQGVKLSDVLRETPSLEPGRVVHIATQCCKALEEAHSKGLVHRDLKPDNIFLQEVAGEQDFVKVLDFGLAKFVSGTYERDNLTHSGYVVGSPEYMAPEQAIGGDITPAVDIYSMGVLLYESLTGVLPFDAETTGQVLRKHILETVPRMFEEGASPLPAALEQLVMQCLEKEPQARPPSAEALRVQLLKAFDRRRRRDTEEDDRAARAALAGAFENAATGDAGEEEPLVTAPGAMGGQSAPPSNHRDSRRALSHVGVQPNNQATVREQWRALSSSVLGSKRGLLARLLGAKSTGQLTSMSGWTLLTVGAAVLIALAAWWIGD